jgi:fermentation-respiration switch protein FrsA (DUF1100 family)
MHRIARSGSVIAGLLLIAYLGVCVAMLFNQASFIYYPERGYDATPASVGLRYEDVPLETKDRVALAAWWVPAQTPRGAVVIAHGNGGNMSHRLDKIRLFHHLGYNVMAFDYRGYGASEGKPSEEGTYADMAAAVDHATAVRGTTWARLVLYGESLGGAVAIEEAVRRTPAALVVDSSFTSVPAMASHYYPWLPARLLLRFRYDSLSRMPALKCPVLVLHSPQDDVVPFAMGRQLFDAAPEPKAFAELAGGHNTGGLMAAPKAQKELAEFLARCIPNEN